MNPTVKFGGQDVIYTSDLCKLKAAGMLADAEFNLMSISRSRGNQVDVAFAQTQIALAQALMQLSDRLSS